MTKYIINENYHGYDKITVKDIEKAMEGGNLHLIILDNSISKELSSYYKYIQCALKNRNRVIIINTEPNLSEFKVLASLMVTFNAYDIYEVNDKESISISYLLKLEEREPDYSEVQSYIGGEITSFSELSNLLISINNIVNDGKTDELKTYLENNTGSIDSIVKTINNMKKTCDLFNSDELINKINELKSENNLLIENIKNKDENIENLKYDRDANNIEVENLKKENSKLKNKLSLSENDNESNNSSVIKTFKTLDLKSLKNRTTKIILYFKEVSYVRYTNTLVTVLQSLLKLHKLNVKTLIYDTNNSLYSKYLPLRVLNGKTYLSEKSNVINKYATVVISEPAQQIINDIVTSDKAFDVVIIYDRMGTQNDIVEGNLVTKFFVINSRQEYENVKDKLKILDNSYIITNVNSSIGIDNKWNFNKEERTFLDIPEIKGFKNKQINSSSYMLNAYKRQATANTNQPLIDTILNKSKIDTLYAKEI